MFYVYIYVLYASDLTCLSRIWSMPGARSILWWLVSSKYLRTKFITSRKRDCFATIVLLRNNVSWLQVFWTLWRKRRLSGRMLSEQLILVKRMCTGFANVYISKGLCPRFSSWRDVSAVIGLVLLSARCLSTFWDSLSNGWRRWSLGNKKSMYIYNYMHNMYIL